MTKVVLMAGCHCGAVRFKVHTRLPLTLLYCNCSICSMVGYLHLIASKDNVIFEHGEDHLALYQFNTKTARHLFCPTCGVKPLYAPRSHPDSWSVNARCLDGDVLKDARIQPFDGANWEANIHQLR